MSIVTFVILYFMDYKYQLEKTPFEIDCSDTTQTRSLNPDCSFESFNRLLNVYKRLKANLSKRCNKQYKCLERLYYR